MQADWKKYRVIRRYAQHVYIEVKQAFNEWSQKIIDKCTKSTKVVAYS